MGAGGGHCQDALPAQEDIGLIQGLCLSQADAHGNGLLHGFRLSGIRALRHGIGVIIRIHLGFADSLRHGLIHVEEIGLICLQLLGCEHIPEVVEGFAVGVLLYDGQIGRAHV